MLSKSTNAAAVVLAVTLGISTMAYRLSPQEIPRGNAPINTQALVDSATTAHATRGVTYETWVTVHDWKMTGKAVVWWREYDSEGWCPCYFDLHSVDTSVSVRYALNCRVRDTPGPDFHSVVFDVPGVSVVLHIHRIVGTGELKVIMSEGPVRDITMVPSLGD